MAKKVQKSQIEEIVEQLLEKGRKTGVLTQSEISDALHEQTGLTAEQLDDKKRMKKILLMKRISPSI